MFLRHKHYGCEHAYLCQLPGYGTFVDISVTNIIYMCCIYYVGVLHCSPKKYALTKVKFGVIFGSLKNEEHQVCSLT